MSDLSSITFRDHVISGLPIRAWNYPRPGGTESKAEVACIFLLHGRLGTSAHVEPFARRLIEKANDRLTNESASKHLIIVTFDHRNHGHRLTSLQANHSWTTHPDISATPIENPTHALDMYAIQTGTAHDVSMLIDFLPAYLYPHEPRAITSWGIVGLSLGGHSAWLCATDPRIRFMVPIIGSPDYETLMRHRAAQSDPPIPFGPPHFPYSLIDLIRQKDPCQLDSKIWEGKHLLVLSGAVDRLVNYVDGGTSAFVDRLKDENRLASIEVVVEDGAGHQITEAMVEKTGDWIVERVLNEGRNVTRMAAL
ncbi:hypothetical protein CROQUDRAFT_653575 [Cronartium quercuum f. sp. fusiforme G11]|uniref:Alpha/beta-hydrolase n=1 Tax=Cronartium quercuum f. sp. fusiforme G11 TaxID=708437 RepID=A0A9P6TEL9_9BASI|nr:hypothetical protein CROQUDRAFT_653575 [Cronartium quercuum f. sp. fusiforme G11]